MKCTQKLLIAGLATGLLAPTASFAQTEQPGFALEEIVVTGRKREESLQEVPISISVLSGALISEAGIVDQQDLFDLVPGIHYDEGPDRNAAFASVRGVQSNEIAPNRTKVTAFIDGMPVLGSQGNIQFGNAQQVEVYRGPQSAAFGRSTFGGAINYITKDPGEEFEGSVRVDLNDYGRQIISGSVSGPINDKVGFMLDASTEDSDAPNEYLATDGTQYGTRSGTSISGKLVFNPTDATEVELAFSHSELEDGPSAGYFITQEARDACFDGTVTSGMGGGVYGTGTLSCDWSQGAQIAAQNDRAALLIANGETNPDRLFLASAQSLPAGAKPGANSERDRFSIQIDHGLDSGAAIQFSGFTSDEENLRQSDGSRNATDEINISQNAMSGLWDVVTGGPMATLGTIMSDPNAIEETYAEVRWVSPGEDRLRYVVGASYYDYTFTTNLFFGGYGAIAAGPEAVARYDALVGNDGINSSVGFPTQVFSEKATNTGVFFNTTYDFTDKLTGTFEARYQSDETGGTDSTSGVSGSVTTDTFLPRISFNYNITDNTSFYGQLARGNNPGGVNVGFFNPGKIDTLDNGIPDGLDADGDGNPNSIYVDYNSDSFVAFEEETLTNIEFGFKGSAFDDRLQYAAAVYKMFWDDQAQSVNLNWDNPDPAALAFENVTNRTFINEGDLEMQGIEFEGTYYATDSVNIRAAIGYLDAEYADYCDVGAIGTGRDFDASKIVRNANFTCYDVTGNEVREQPSITASFSPSYNTEVGNGLNLSVRGDIKYEGSQYFDSSNLMEKEAVTTVNLSVGLRADRWDAALYVNNVTDEDSPLRVGGGNDYSITSDTANLGTNFQSNYFVNPRQPRTIGLRLGYNF